MEFIPPGGRGARIDAPQRGAVEFGKRHARRSQFAAAVTFAGMA